MNRITRTPVLEGTAALRTSDRPSSRAWLRRRTRLGETALNSRSDSPSPCRSTRPMTSGRISRPEAPRRFASRSTMSAWIFTRTSSGRSRKASYRRPLKACLRQPVFELFGAGLFLGLFGGPVFEQRDKRLQRIVAPIWSIWAAVKDQIFGDPRLLGRDAVQRHDPREMDDGARQSAAQRMVEKDRVQDLPRRRVEPKRNVREAEDDLTLGHCLGNLLDRVERVEAEAAVVLVAGADRKGQRVKQQIGGRQAVPGCRRNRTAGGRSRACARPPWPCRSRRWSRR